MKKIILLSTFAILGVLVLDQAVYAANSTLSVLPSTASKNVGTTFNLTVQLNPQGNKVCMVKGTLSFNDLTCRSITIASGLMAQTTPTCASPSFILGIPKCTTVAQNILTVSVKGNNVGQAKAALTGSSVIGVGVLIPSDSQAGVYNITAVPTPAPTLAPETTTQVEASNSTTSANIASTTAESAESASLQASTGTPALFDITAEPVLPARQSVIPLVVFSAVAGVWLILLAILAARWIWILVVARKKKEQDVKSGPTQKVKNQRL